MSNIWTPDNDVAIVTNKPTLAKPCPRCDHDMHDLEGRCKRCGLQLPNHGSTAHRHMISMRVYVDAVRRLHDPGLTPEERLRRIGRVEGAGTVLIAAGFATPEVLEAAAKGIQGQILAREKGESHGPEEAAEDPKSAE